MAAIKEENLWVRQQAAREAACWPAAKRQAAGMLDRLVILRATPALPKLQQFDSYQRLAFSNSGAVFDQEADHFAFLRGFDLIE